MLTTMVGCLERGQRSSLGQEVNKLPQKLRYSTSMNLSMSAIHLGFFDGALFGQ